MPERGWHTIELPDGSVSDAWWDFRPLAPRLPWPEVRGKRCLDVGTADGFWAFALERRGAAEVVALDRPSYFQSECRARFEEAHARLGSRVRYEEGDVYELAGEFDLTFMGYVLQVVTDPLGAPRVGAAREQRAAAARHRLGAPVHPAVAARAARRAP
jgi:tRNA (mo5U34)-methyltransferase